MSVSYCLQRATPPCSSQAKTLPQPIIRSAGEPRFSGLLAFNRDHSDFKRLEHTSLAVCQDLASQRYGDVMFFIIKHDYRGEASQSPLRYSMQIVDSQGYVFSTKPFRLDQPQRLKQHNNTDLLVAPRPSGFLKARFALGADWVQMRLVPDPVMDHKQAKIFHSLPKAANRHYQFAEIQVSVKHGLRHHRLFNSLQRLTSQPHITHTFRFAPTYYHAGHSPRPYDYGKLPGLSIIAVGRTPAIEAKADRDLQQTLGIASESCLTANSQTQAPLYFPAIAEFKGQYPQADSAWQAVLAKAKHLAPSLSRVEQFEAVKRDISKRHAYWPSQNPSDWRMMPLKPTATTTRKHLTWQQRIAFWFKQRQPGPFKSQPAF